MCRELRDRFESLAPLLRWSKKSRSD